MIAGRRKARKFCQLIFNLYRLSGFPDNQSSATFGTASSMKNLAGYADPVLSFTI